MVNNAIETVAKKITGKDGDDDETVYGGPDCPHVRIVPRNHV
jgi:hypothetical protein